MNALFEATEEICAFLQQRGWQFCIIGGLAVLKWGEPRTTLDTDIALLTAWGEEEGYIDVLLDHFPSRVSDAREFALVNRVLLLRASNGKDIDISLGAMPFEVDMVQRAVMLEFSFEKTLPCCTAEDLVIMKAFANRPRDWTDIEGIAARQSALDTDYIFRHLLILSELKESPEIVERARNVLR